MNGTCVELEPNWPEMSTVTVTAGSLSHGPFARLEAILDPGTWGIGADPTVSVRWWGGFLFLGVDLDVRFGPLHALMAAGYSRDLEEVVP